MNGYFRIKRGATTLADGDTARVIDGPRWSGQHTLDVVTPLFATKPTIHDRLGGSLVCTFTISRTHDSLALSFNHAAQVFQAVRGKADLTIELVDGGTTYTWNGADCGWQSTEVPEPTGVGTAVQYRVLVPRVTSDQFDAEGNLVLLNEDGTPLLNEDETPISNA